MVEIDIQPTAQIEIEIGEDINPNDIPPIPASRVIGGTFEESLIPASITRDSKLSAAITAHTNESDPHPTYAKDTDLTGAVSSIDAALALINAALAGKQGITATLTDLIASPSTSLGRAILRAASAVAARLLLFEHDDIRQSTKPTTRSDGSALQAGDRWLDTSTNMRWYWDSSLSVWLSEQLFHAEANTIPTTGNTGSYGLLPVDSAGDDLYIIQCRLSGSVATPNDGTNHWTMQFVHRSTTTQTAISNQFNTSAYAVNDEFFINQTMTLFLDVSALSIKSLRISTGKSNTPGNFQSTKFRIDYRRAKV